MGHKPLNGMRTPTPSRGLKRPMRAARPSNGTRHEDAHPVKGIETNTCYLHGHGLVNGMRTPTPSRGLKLCPGRLKTSWSVRHEDAHPVKGIETPSKRKIAQEKPGMRTPTPSRGLKRGCSLSGRLLHRGMRTPTPSRGLKRVVFLRRIENVLLGMRTPTPSRGLKPKNEASNHPENGHEDAHPVKGIETTPTTTD